MYIVYGYAEIFLPFSSSLKEKRKVINSIIDRVRKRYNISIAEVSHHDLWQRSGIGFSAISGKLNDLDNFSNKIKDTILLFPETVEILHFDCQVIRHEKNGDRS